MTPILEVRSPYHPCFSSRNSIKIVDDLLESMLDGWVFGERQGEHAAAGIIPAVKPSGSLRPGDQRRAVAYLEHR